MVFSFLKMLMQAIIFDFKVDYVALSLISDQGHKSHLPFDINILLFKLNKPFCDLKCSFIMIRYEVNWADPGSSPDQGIWLDVRIGAIGHFQCVDPDQQMCPWCSCWSGLIPLNTCFLNMILFIYHVQKYMNKCLIFNEMQVFLKVVFVEFPECLNAPFRMTRDICYFMSILTTELD